MAAYFQLSREAGGDDDQHFGSLGHDRRCDGVVEQTVGPGVGRRDDHEAVVGGVVAVEAGIQPRAAVHDGVQLELVGGPGARVRAAGDVVGPVSVRGELFLHHGSALQQPAEVVDRQRRRAGAAGRSAGGQHVVEARGAAGRAGQRDGDSVGGDWHDGRRRREVALEPVRAAVRQVVAAAPHPGVEQEVVELPLAQGRGVLGGDRPMPVGDAGDARRDQQAEHRLRLCLCRGHVGDPDRRGQRGEQGAAALAVQQDAHRAARRLHDQRAGVLAALGEREA